jgi:hypothetical protein
MPRFSITISFETAMMPSSFRSPHLFGQVIMIGSSRLLLLNQFQVIWIQLRRSAQAALMLGILTNPVKDEGVTQITLFGLDATWLASTEPGVRLQAH